MLDSHLTNKPFINDQFIKLLKRYAVILVIMLLIRTFNYTLLPLLSTIFSATDVYQYQAGSSFLFFIINLVTAAFIYADMKKINLMSWSIVILTLLSNEMGVTLFLLFVLYYTVKPSE